MKKISQVLARAPRRRRTRNVAKTRIRVPKRATKKQKPITLRELRQFLRCSLQYELSFSKSIIELNLISLRELGIIKYLRQPDHSITLMFVADTAEQVPGLAQSLAEI